MQTNKNQLIVTEIQRFCMHDGPGVRTVVFLKGCHIRCKWCHNPETQSAKRQIMFAYQKCISCGACEAVCTNGAQIVLPERKFDRTSCETCGKCVEVCPAAALTSVGESMDVDVIISRLKRDIPFYGKDGGLTVSGGEPTFQPDGLVDLLTAAKSEGITTCIETCGVFPKEYIKSLMPLVDTFLFDVKDTDSERLRENTGADLTRVIENLKSIDTAGGKTVLRCIMIPDVNMNKEHIDRLAELYGELQNCEYVELLPYHPYGTSKAEQVGIDDQKVYETPNHEEITAFAEMLKNKNVPVKCFGTMALNIKDI